MLMVIHRCFYADDIVERFRTRPHNLHPVRVRQQQPNNYATYVLSKTSLLWFMSI